MKIAIYSDNVAPYRIAWAEEIGKKHEVVFAYTKDKDAERNDAWLIRNSRFCKLVKLPAIIVKNYAVSLNVIHHIKKYLPDVVIFDGYGIIPNALGMLYLNMHKKEYFVNVDGIHLGAKESFIKRIIKKCVFNRNYSHFFCGSDISKNWLISMGMDESKIVVHNFSSIHDIDILPEILSSREKKQVKTELNMDDKPTILAVGRFLDWKQFDLLIKAFISLDLKYQLYIIGEGEEKVKYENLIQDNKLHNVHIVDFMNYQKLKNYYKAADLFVLPSYGEVWGLVVNEAMSFGLPVITTDLCVAGQALIDVGKNGYRFTYNDVDELTRYMDIILSDTGLRHQMSINSLNKVREYTIENTAAIHLQYLEKWGKV